MDESYCARCCRGDVPEYCGICRSGSGDGEPEMFLDRDGRIHAGDMVRNRESGEKLLVAGVNPETGFFVPMGYPFPSIEKTSDYDLVERNAVPVTEHIKSSLKKHGMESYIEDT